MSAVVAPAPPAPPPTPRIARGAALKRLAAGGMVLVAGDNHVPDETYLKAFREDVLVLVGPELVLPIPPIDQTTKKKDPAPAPMVVPGGAVRPILVPAVPAVKPGVIIKGRAAGVAVPAARYRLLGEGDGGPPVPRAA